jgi:hypothetical protein
VKKKSKIKHFLFFLTRYRYKLAFFSIYPENEKQKHIDVSGGQPSIEISIKKITIFFLLGFRKYFHQIGS